MSVNAERYGEDTNEVIDFIVELTLATSFIAI